MSQKLSTGLFAIPIICLLLTLIIVLTFFLINPITVGVPVDLPKKSAKELSKGYPIISMIEKNDDLFSTPPPPQLKKEKLAKVLSLLAQKKEPRPLPSKVNELIIITMLKNGRLYINDIKLKQDIIPQAKLSELRNKKVYLRADKKVEYGKVIEVLGQLKKENIEVSLVTKTDSSADKKTSKSNKLTKSSKIIPLPPWPTSQKISSETIEKIRKHIMKCWYISIGFDELKGNVILKIALRKDMSVFSVGVVDKKKYVNNTLYKAVAESARRAVLDCSPLPLDNSYYETLKEFEMEFNPRFSRKVL